MERLKAYKARLVVFPKKGKKPALPENAASTVAAADGAGHLYISKDAGRSWSSSSDRIPTPSSLLVLDPTEAVNVGGSARYR